MKILKHNSKEQYAFIEDTTLTGYADVYVFEKFKNTFKNNIYNLESKEDNKKYK